MLSGIQQENSLLRGSQRNLEIRKLPIQSIPGLLVLRPKLRNAYTANNIRGGGAIARDHWPWWECRPMSLQHPLKAWMGRRRRQPWSAAPSPPRRRAKIRMIAHRGWRCRRFGSTREALRVTLAMWHKDFVVIHSTWAVNVAPNSHTPHHASPRISTAASYSCALPSKRLLFFLDVVCHLVEFFPSSSAVLEWKHGILSWQRSSNT